MKIGGKEQSGVVDETLFFLDVLNFPSCYSITWMIINKHFEYKRRGHGSSRAESSVIIYPGLPPFPEFKWNREDRAVKRTEARAGLGAMGSQAGCWEATWTYLSRFPSCVLRRSWRPAPWEERGPRLLLQVICLLLLPAPPGAGGLPTAVLPVRWDVEWHPAQLHR